MALDFSIPAGSVLVTAPAAFVAVWGTTTSAEIEEAYQAGKVMYCLKDDYLFGFCRRYSATNHQFSLVKGTQHITISNSANTWLEIIYELAAADEELNGSSVNPVQNKAVKAALDKKIEAPENPSVGQVLMWDGSKWTAASL